LARNIEPIKVIYTKEMARVLVLPAVLTILRATMVKNLRFFKAQITANVQKRQVNVLKSKYPIYSASGVTIKQEIIASVAAITSTVFFAAKDLIEAAVSCKSAWRCEAEM